MTTTVQKEVHDGATYVRIVSRDEAGAVVTDELSKTDPVLRPTVPAPAAPGATVLVPFALVDFDGAVRDDSGTVYLDIGGTVFDFELTDGAMALTLQLHDDVRIALADPFLADMRMAPFVLEVTV